MAKIILCTDKNGGIGFENSIPWHSSEDFKHFKEETAGKIVVMGYNTWKSLPKRPLPGRLNIVLLSREYDDRDEHDIGTNVLFMDVDSIGEILTNNPEAIVMGGARIYEAAMPYIDGIILSTVTGDYTCDTFFNVTRFDYEYYNVLSTKELSDGTVVEYIDVKVKPENIWEAND